jgi:cyclophilin family peptidyl-prolyl cis-trans isomerase
MANKPNQVLPTSRSTRIIFFIFLTIILVVPTIGVIVSATDSGNTDASGSPKPSTSPTVTPRAVTDTELQNPIVPADAKTASQVVLKTNKGDIRLNLFKDETPLTVQNFVTLGSRGYYNSVIFHRVIAGFMIQGGDPTGTGRSGESIYGDRFKDEFTNTATRKIVKGTLAMANAGANTNGSQFFIVSDTAQPQLDGKHTNFGEVADTASMDVVTAISKVQVNSADKPLTAVTITGFEVTAE